MLVSHLPIAIMKRLLHLLKERYGQKHKIINAYMKSLLDLPALQSNLLSLKEFYDTTESYIRGLESLRQQEETFGTMLIPILMDKLPSNVKINITRANGSDRWTLESLRRCILHEITILEAGQTKTTLDFVQQEPFMPLLQLLRIRNHEIQTFTLKQRI
jgi:hypothetical protein